MKFLWPGAGKVNVYGLITSPQHYGTLAGIQAGRPWAADLGCIEGPKYVKKVGKNAMEWIKTMRPYQHTCLFISGFDVVEDAQATLEAYKTFERMFLTANWPLAYVAQDGSESLPIPETCSAVFVGGSTEWKVSMEAVSVIKRAQNLGKHVHIGRVNWWKRYAPFRILKGSEEFTCDGTRPRFDGTENTERAWRQYEAQLPLIQI